MSLIDGWIDEKRETKKMGERDRDGKWEKEREAARETVTEKERKQYFLYLAISTASNSLYNSFLPFSVFIYIMCHHYHRVL